MVPRGCNCRLLSTKGSGKNRRIEGRNGIVRPSERIVTGLDDYLNDLVGRSVQDIVDFGIPLVPTGGASFRADPRFYLEP